MGYCMTCGEWCGYSTSYCENQNCELTRKLIGLYGIDKIGTCLAKVFVREEKAIENRTTKIDTIKIIPDVTKYNLRKKNEID
tara:strand:+ start:106 stop:351 length:246 start_codon:yes stop_codon:yes gene_type:complete